MIGWLEFREDLVLASKRPDGLGSEALKRLGMVVWQVLVAGDGLVLSEKRWEEKDGEVSPPLARRTSRGGCSPQQEQQHFRRQQ